MNFKTFMNSKAVTFNKVVDGLALQNKIVL